MPEPLHSLPDGAFASHTSSPYLEQLAQLATPVPNLAGTLTTQVEQDAEEDNLSFLRGESLDDDSHNGNEESHRRMRRSVNTTVGGRHYTPAQLRELGELEERANRIVRQEYDGWAPEMSEDEDMTEHGARRLPVGSSSTLLDEHVLRRDEHLRDRMRLRRWRDHVASRYLEGPSRTQDHRATTSFEQSHVAENRATGVANETSFQANAAMLQAARRTHAFSTHSRHQLQRYILDRERIGNEGEERERMNSTDLVAPANASLSSSQRRQVQHEALVRHEIQQHRDMLAEHQQHRSYLEEQLRQQQQRHGFASAELRRRRLWQTRSSSPPCEKQSLDKAITYLGSLRLCETNEEGFETAEDRGFDPYEFGPKDRQDFLLDTTHIPSPPKSSWLQAGAVLSGTQHATSGTQVLPYTSLQSPSQYRSRIRNPTSGSAATRTTSPVRSNPHSPTPDRQSERSRTHSEDRWPVKVTVHDVNYENMMLSGTMEAFDVPDKSSPTQSSSITTYLEGEIIDFNTFTLETKSFEAGTRVDGTYWRKLPPFKDLKDDDTVIKNLLSRDWLCKELMEKWILMRWKEKCFVGPSDRQSSLTINGFYYISLRRDDGHVEGLYYDPLSTPYQHLSLMPEKRMFPAYTFQ